MRVLRAPSGRELEQLALEIGDNDTLCPGEQRWYDQTDALPAPRRRVTQDMLRTVVAQVVNPAPVIAPGADVDTIVAQEACSLDIALVGPARGTVKKRIHAKSACDSQNNK